MARFLQEADYSPRIAAEIKRMVTGTTDEVSGKQLIAEETAIALITEYIGGRKDCAIIFTAWDGTGTDTRNAWIVKCVITLALYDLYHQTGVRDIPEHRQTEYDTVISWLKDVGRGNINSSLPDLPEEQNPGDFRLNSRPPVNHKW